MHGCAATHTGYCRRCNADVVLELAPLRGAAQARSTDAQGPRAVGDVSQRVPRQEQRLEPHRPRVRSHDQRDPGHREHLQPGRLFVCVTPAVDVVHAVRLSHYATWQYLLRIGVHTETSL